MATGARVEQSRGLNHAHTFCPGHPGLLARKSLWQNQVRRWFFHSLPDSMELDPGEPV